MREPHSSGYQSINRTRNLRQPGHLDVSFLRSLSRRCRLGRCPRRGSTNFRGTVSGVLIDDVFEMIANCETRDAGLFLNRVRLAIEEAAPIKLWEPRT